MPNCPTGRCGAIKERFPRRTTTIAVDFDRTFTADPVLWRSFMTTARRRGHSVYIVTGRNQSSVSAQLIRRYLGEAAKFTHILFCHHGPKRAAAESRGVQVDIWIDDVPEVIGAASVGEVAQIEERFTMCEPLLRLFRRRRQSHEQPSPTDA